MSRGTTGCHGPFGGRRAPGTESRTAVRASASLATTRSSSGKLCPETTGVGSWPGPASPQPLRLTDAALHGAWGLQLTWNDGHATGIFPFEALRRWSEGRRAFGPDSGLAGAGDP